MKEVIAMIELFEKYERENLSLTEKIQLTENDLLKAGFYVDEMEGSIFNKNYAYLSEHSPYAVVIIQHIMKEQLKYFCILDRIVYDRLKLLSFSVNPTKGSVYDNIQDTSKYRVIVCREKFGIKNCPIYDLIVDKGNLPLIDHQLHSHGINVCEFLRPATRKQNAANKKGSKSDDPVFRYKYEEDFSFTWYVFIYWKVMGIISRREAFDYNLKYNK